MYHSMNGITIGNFLDLLNVEKLPIFNRDNLSTYVSTQCNCDYLYMFDRHVLVSSGPLLTPEQWEVCSIACYHACSNSLQELHQLTMAFSPRSESFYGDVAQVKVAARRDATPEESERLRQLSAQVSNPEIFLFLKWQRPGLIFYL